jgi:LacI family transcriptional regulator
MKTRVTQKQIAEILGISVNTVSRALKDMPDIGQATRERVVEAARKLGYTPNVAARSLVLNRTNTIGLAVTELKNPVRNEFMAQLHAAVSNYGCRMLVADLSEDNQENSAALRDLLGRGIDGLIIGGMFGIIAESPLWGVLQEYARAGVPVVAFGDIQTGLIDNVKIDFANNARMLTEHLVKLDYKHIAFWGGDGPMPRHDGYAAAMASAGLEKNIDFFHCGVGSMDNGEAAVAEYMASGRRLPEAIVAVNDLLAIGIIAGLRRYGVAVPDDVAVAGFDNIDFGKYLEAPLTTVGVDRDELSDALLELLFQRINNDNTESGLCREVHGHLIVRSSCGNLIRGQA